ncbi:hypothetical protein CHCC20335_0226 [Bacillus paralicheniformis]|nr:hypothetical protein CHCC20335_0226 [Bacillus paralicheniformis]
MDTPDVLSLRSHVSAGLGTSETAFSAYLAMAMLMEAALVSACFTNLCTQQANIFSIRAVPCHCLDGGMAYVGAFSVQADAFGHHGGVFFH